MSKKNNTNIAVIGMSCRFPGSKNVEEYHDLLKNGYCVIETIPDYDSLQAGIPTEILESKNFVNKAAVLENIFEFDTELFSLSDHDSQVIDPQQYHFLECCYEALSVAKCLSLNKRIGIFAGGDSSIFSKSKIDQSVLWDPIANWNIVLLNDNHFLTTWVSYRLGLKGPSVGLQTACSTSLVAVHMACNSLLAGECDIAIAGGVSIRGPQKRGYLYREGGILSPTGSCKPFSDEGDGTVLSSGVGVVVLQLSKEAESDGRKIWANIIGSAINNDGDFKASYTSPNGSAQDMVIKEAQVIAGITPEKIGYIEAHGTGTKIGDAIEFNSLNRIFKKTNITCFIGSVKSNFGHLESAAGIAGLIKTILSVRFNEIYPLVGFINPNKEIDLSNNFLRFPRRLERFENNLIVRRAGISSFGIGGTNCHIIIEENCSSKNIADLSDLESTTFKRKKIVQNNNLTQIKSLIELSNDGKNIDKFIETNWEKIIKIRPTIENDFFENGGESLSAMQLIARINDEFHVNLNMSEFYQNSKYEELLLFIKQRIKGKDERTYLLSPNQKGLIAHNRINKNKSDYNVYMVLKIKGKLDLTLLKESFQLLIERHEVFKTRFFEEGDNFYQIVEQEISKCPFNFKEINDEEKITEALLSHCRLELDLSKPPLISILVIKDDIDSYLFSVVTHHIISDEWSANVIIKELITFYQSLTHGIKYCLPALNTTFRDLAEKEQFSIYSYSTKKKINFWRNYLKDLEPLKLGINQLGEIKTGDRIYFEIEIEKYSRVGDFASKNRITSFSIFLSLFEILLYRYSNSNEFIIGLNSSGRNDQITEDIVGYFTNTLPIKCEIKKQDKFSYFSRKVQNMINDIVDNQLPLSVIIEELGGRNIEPEILLVYQNVPKTILNLEGINIKKIPFHNGSSKFNIEVVLSEIEDENLECYVEFDNQKYSRAFIKRFIQHYTSLVNSIDVIYEKEIKNITIIFGEERNLILKKFNSLKSDSYFRIRDIWIMFKKHVEDIPHKPAIILHNDTEFTYKEIYILSLNILNKVLTNFNTKQNSIIGIFCYRSEKFLASVLAIQASACTFLPLDPNVPDNRIIEILEDSGIDKIIACQELFDRIKKISTKFMSNIDLVNCDQTTAEIEVKEEFFSYPDNAYVMYTSGTTGKPKGAIVSQSGMMNHLNEKIRTLSLNEHSILAQTSSLSFDISVWQFLAPILTGGTVVLFSESQINNINDFIYRLDEHKCTIVEMVPSYLEVFIQSIGNLDLKHLKYLISTGEVLSSTLANKWLSLLPKIPLINAYGPTECADDVLQFELCCKLDDSSIVPIGYPLDNINIYILDNDMEPLPIGAVGQIYIGGIAVGNGYLNNSDLTLEYFSEHNFSDGNSTKLYKTGDLGTWREDGVVLYFGRQDAQVKIHGARVELSEVESLINKYDQIKQCIVDFDKINNTLIAFYIPKTKNFNVDDLRNYCKLNLPFYMQPTKFNLIENIPRNYSGKIDRTKLNTYNDKQKSILHSESVSSSYIERILKEVWIEVLDIEEVRDDSDFFEDGGDSLNVIRFVAKINKRGINLTSGQLMENPKFGTLIKQIKCQKPFMAFEESNLINNSKLTMSEKWYFERYGTLENNKIDFLIELPKAYSVKLIKNDLIEILCSHPRLRTVYFEDKNKVIQKRELHPDSMFPEIINLNENYSKNDFNSLVNSLCNNTFYYDAPLFNGYIFQVRNLNYILLQSHYLLCDHLSWQILLDSFFDKYNTRVNSGKKNARKNIISMIINNGEFKPIKVFNKYFVYRSFHDLLEFSQILESIMVYLLNKVLIKMNINAKPTFALGRNERTISSEEENRLIGRYSYYKILKNVCIKPNQSVEKNIRNISNKINESITLDSKEFTLVSLDYLGVVKPLKSYLGSSIKIQRIFTDVNLSPNIFPIECIYWLEANEIYLVVKLDNKMINMAYDKFLDNIFIETKLLGKELSK